MQHTRKRAGLLKSALLGAATLGALSLAGAGVAQAAVITFDFTTHVSPPGVLPSSTTASTANTTACAGTTGIGCTAYGSYGSTGSATTPTGAAVTYTSTGGATSLTAYAEYLSSGIYLNAAVTQTTGFGITEGGLGVQSAIVHNASKREIAAGEYLLLDVSNITASGSITGVQLGSIQSGEGGAVYAQSSLDLASLPTAAATLQNGVTGGVTQSYTFPSALTSANWLIITADNTTNSSGNVLLNTLTVKFTPPAKVPEPGSLALLGTGLLGLGLVARRRRRKA